MYYCLSVLTSEQAMGGYAQAEHYIEEKAEVPLSVQQGN